MHRVEMYHFSKKNSKVNNNFFTTRTWYLFFLVNAIVYLAALILCIIIGSVSRKITLTYHFFNLSKEEYGKEHLRAEGYFLAGLSLLFAIAFPTYGYMLFQRLERAVLSSNIKKRMVSKVRKNCRFSF